MNHVIAHFEPENVHFADGRNLVGSRPSKTSTVDDGPHAIQWSYMLRPVLKGPAMQIEAVLLGDAWSCLVNAATTHVLDVERRVAPPMRELMRNILRGFIDQHVPRSNEELRQRHMQMTGLVALVGAVSQVDTTARTAPYDSALMQEARRLAEMPLPATDQDFSELNVAIMAFYANLNTPSFCGSLQPA